MTIKYSSSQGYTMLKQGDKNFTFSPNGVTLVPRACFEISQNCPREYVLVVQECINNGWLKPVANLRNPEYTMELLRE